MFSAEAHVSEVRLTNRLNSSAAAATLSPPTAVQRIHCCFSPCVFLFAHTDHVDTLGRHGVRGWLQTLTQGAYA